MSGALTISTRADRVILSHFLVWWMMFSNERTRTLWNLGVHSVFAARGVVGFALYFRREEFVLVVSPYPLRSFWSRAVKEIDTGFRRLVEARL